MWQVSWIQCSKIIPSCSVTPFDVYLSSLQIFARYHSYLPIRVSDRIMCCWAKCYTFPDFSALKINWLSSQWRGRRFAHVFVDLLANIIKIHCCIFGVLLYAHLNTETIKLWLDCLPCNHAKQKKRVHHNRHNLIQRLRSVEVKVVRYICFQRFLYDFPLDARLFKLFLFYFLCVSTILGNILAVSSAFVIIIFLPILVCVSNMSY